MTSVFQALGSAIYGTLTSGTALTALLASTTSVYHPLPPDEATLPYVVFSISGGPENICAADLHDNLVNIQGYARTPAAAAAIDAQVDALVNKKVLSVSGFTNFWSVRENDLEYAEREPNGQIIYHAGAIYRIRLTA